VRGREEEEEEEERQRRQEQGQEQVVEAYQTPLVLQEIGASSEEYL